MNNEKPPLIVFPGFEFSGGERDMSMVYRLSPTKRFDVIIRTDWWNNPDEGPDALIARARAEIEEIAKDRQRPVGVAALSASAPLPIAASVGLDSSVVAGIAAIVGPVNPLAALNVKALKRYEEIKRNTPNFIAFLQHFAEIIVPQLDKKEKDRILSIHGTRDSNVPPEMSIMPGAENQRILTPPIPLPFVLHDLRHGYNLARALKSRKLTKFFEKKLGI